MKAAKYIFGALMILGSYYVQKTYRVEDELSTMPDRAEKVDTTKTIERIPKDTLVKKKPRVLEEVWDPNYVDHDPTYLHYSDEDELRDYFD